VTQRVYRSSGSRPPEQPRSKLMDSPCSIAYRRHSSGNSVTVCNSRRRIPE
jgi:hypothetical protein